MGLIKITVQGSFTHPQEKEFSAMNGGHAQAVTQAIEFLSGQFMSDAIKLGHRLHSQEKGPEHGFGEK